MILVNRLNVTVLFFSPFRQYLHTPQDVTLGILKVISLAFLLMVVRLIDESFAELSNVQWIHAGTEQHCHLLATNGAFQI